MKLKNKEAWKKWVDANQDPYGSACVRYAQRWAELMEKEMKHTSLEDVAQRTSHDADTDAITGFMYGCAINMLAECWEHGEDLRIWHNAQHGQSGPGVVNPAIITFKPKGENGGF